MRELTIVEVSVSRGVTFSEPVIQGPDAGAENIYAARGQLVVTLGGRGGPALTLPIADWGGAAPAVGTQWNVSPGWQNVMAADGTSRACPFHCGAVVA